MERGGGGAEVAPGPPFSAWHVRGRRLALDRPRVMGILNATPDSFFAGSRVAGVEAALERAEA
ncbi:MAG TPA: hypothetical protein VMK65_04080, partial [Longimicrobiales bacterium]|nr:hypothetical protein [Longimicrobiales bacterium]